jgi:antitoxin component YwqK of YwqJK toxin-antitoxin module
MSAAENVVTVVWDTWLKPGAEAAFKNGKQVGLWTRYYENGKLWDEGTYEDGKKVGEWKVYDKAGALKQSKIFKRKW